MRFKRNQVEEAVAATLQRKEDLVTPDLRIRIKRLLDTDRTLGRDTGSDDPERASFAFYSGEPPGSGVEVWFSSYEAFALLMALRLLSHGWPQRTVVRIMRRVRPELEREHDRILSQDPRQLFDADEVRRRAYEGAVAVDNIDPVFLAIPTPEQPHRPDPNEPDPTIAFAVRRGQAELMKFILQDLPVGTATTIFELVNAAHRLEQCLAQTQPSKRGRGG